MGLDLNLNTTIVAGTDIDLIFQAVRCDDPETPVVMSDFSEIIWTLKQQYGGAVLLQKTLSSGIITVPVPAGDKFIVPIAHADTTALVGPYLHEAKLIDPLGNITAVTLCNFDPGKITIRSAL